jgi:hypothetical protein
MKTYDGIGEVSSRWDSTHPSPATGYVCADRKCPSLPPAATVPSGASCSLSTISRLSPDISRSCPYQVGFKLFRRLFPATPPRPCSGHRAFSMGRRKNKKKSHWSAYNPTDTSADPTEGGSPGGPAFFHYHPGSSGMNQSWWFNTFGKQQDPPLETEEDPSASTSSETKNEVRNEFPLEPKSYDPKYREYRPPQTSSRPRSRTATPPPPQGPSLDYIATSDDPSRPLADPASSRKLLVLDLNGTLLHRSPRTNKNQPRYPIPGQEGFQPRLRSVHPRPYLPSFKSYMFHPSTKEWLDVMVWSSAQPHSVHDMVDKCFHDEKHHFVAVWARDTLGLPQHLYSTAIPPITYTTVDTQYTSVDLLLFLAYHNSPLKDRKVQTLKDLNIPWSKLFTPGDPPGVEPHSTSHHTAMSTLLMDDSPRKAELQPYNHLCVKEYSSAIRNRDLASMQEEKARLKPPSPPPTAEGPQPQAVPPPSPQLSVEIPHTLIPSTIHHHRPTQFDLPPPSLDPSPDFQFDQSVGIQPGATLLNPLPFTSNTGGYPPLPGDNGLGQGVIAPQMLFKNPSPPMMGYQNPQALQQLSRSINPFASPQHTHNPQSRLHPPLTETPARSVPSTQGISLPPVEITTEEAKTPSDLSPSTSTSKKRKRKSKREAEHNASEADPAHVIKYDETLLAVVGILDEIKFQSNVASWAKANGLWGPYPPQNLVDPGIDAFTRDNFRMSCEDVTTLSDGGSVESGRRGEGKKKRRDAVAAFFEATVMDEPEGTGSIYAPTNEKQNQENISETPLWFDNPPTVRHWVDRGRKALETLGIPIEHGLKQ